MLGIPVTYEEAISLTNLEHWEKAMEVLEENDAYGLIPVSKVKAVVGGRWIYSIKTDASNSS